MDEIDWRLFDTGTMPLRRCSSCQNQVKFDAAATESYYCARLKQWTPPMFDCPFWIIDEDWNEWYAYSTSLRAKEWAEPP